MNRASLNCWMQKHMEMYNRAEEIGGQQTTDEFANAIRDGDVELLKSLVQDGRVDRELVTQNATDSLERYIQRHGMPDQKQIDAIKKLMLRDQLDFALIKDCLTQKSVCHPLWSLALIVWHGANLHAKNKHGKTVIDLVSDPTIKALILEIALVKMQLITSTAHKCLCGMPGEQILCENCVQFIQNEIPHTEANDQLTCKICLDRQFDVALECGHLICSTCASEAQFDTRCPFCNKIIDKFNLKKVFFP